MINLPRILIRLTRALYPTGRAWALRVGTFLREVHRVLNLSEERALNDGSLAILDGILADNENFDATDAGVWERRLGIVVSPGTTLVDRRAAILRKYSSPGNILGRQSLEYIEGQLQAANFNVFLHEDASDIESENASRLGDEPTRLGNFRLAGNVGDLELIADRINVSEETFVVPSDRSAMFVVGAQIRGDIANVPAVRRNEFRALILTLKPAHTAAFLLVNYT